MNVVTPEQLDLLLDPKKVLFDEVFIVMETVGQAA